jgi:hypothetical protein
VSGRIPRIARAKNRANLCQWITRQKELFMRKFFASQSNYLALPLFALAFAWNLAQGAWVPAPSSQLLPGLANSVALGPTMRPPCCDVSQNGAPVAVASGPTMPPPCCDVSQNDAPVAVASGPTMPPPCCDVSQNGAPVAVASGPTMPPPCCNVLGIIRPDRAPSLAADRSSDFSEGSPVRLQVHAALRATVPPQPGVGVRVI